MTDINEIIAGIEGLLAAGEDAKAEAALTAAIGEYAAAHPDNVVGQSVLLNELGGFYRSRGVYDKGEEAYLKAKELLEEMREYVRVVDAPGNGGEDQRCILDVVYKNQTRTENYATTLNNLAGLYRMDQQLQKAAETFDAAISAYENCEGDITPDHFASVYNNKGLVCLDQRDTAGARIMFLKAKEILEKGGTYPFALGTTISNLGFAALMEKKYDEAAVHFEKAKNLFVEAGAGDMVKNCEDLLSRLVAGS